MKPREQATALESGPCDPRRSVLSSRTHRRRDHGLESQQTLCQPHSAKLDLPNLFVYGASAFPQKLRRRPTGLACRWRILIREDPGHLPQIWVRCADVIEAAWWPWSSARTDGADAALAVSYVVDPRGGEGLTAPAPTAAVNCARRPSCPLGTVPHATAARTACLFGRLPCAHRSGAIYTTTITPEPKPWLGRFTLAVSIAPCASFVSLDIRCNTSECLTPPIQHDAGGCRCAVCHFQYAVPPASVPKLGGGRPTDLVFPLSMLLCQSLLSGLLLFSPKPSPFRSPCLWNYPEGRQGRLLWPKAWPRGECPYAARVFLMEVRAPRCRLPCLPIVGE